MAVRHDPIRGWVVDVTVRRPNGDRVRERRRSPVQTRAGAEKYEREVIPQLVNPAPHRQAPRLGEYVEEFMEHAEGCNKPSEVESKRGIFRRYLLPALGDLRLDEIRVREIERLKADLLQRVSAKTARNALGVLLRALRFAVECEVLGAVPRVRMPKVGEQDFDFLTFEEADRLLRAAEGDDWHAAVLIGMRTGLRWGELSELRWGDVDLVNAKVIVRRSYTHGHVGTPKSGKKREVPLSPEALAALKAGRHLKGELVFCKHDGGRRIHRRADVAIKRLCRLAGLRSIGWHVLRHTFASHLVMRGVPLRTVQELMGHSDIRQTLRYAHLAPGMTTDAVALLDGPVKSLVGHKTTRAVSA